MEIASILIANGADVNGKDKHGNMPLHRAAAGDNRGMVELLISKGADANAKNNRGRTPLNMAESEEMKALLRKHGAKE